MLIGEFSRATGLSPDTIRFYVRKGLLTPQTGSKGGRQPWQIFREQDIAVARLIRTAQSVGLSLREIDELSRTLHDDPSPEREGSVLDDQISRLEKKALQIAGVLSFLRAKRNWIASGKAGTMPTLASFSLQ